jgi:hypothetical protein
MKVGRTRFWGLAVVAALLATPAQAGCWSKEAVAAAKIREFETMLMVSALRCRNGGRDFLARYNQFVREGRPVLTQVNDMLRTQFTSELGAGRGLNAYDGFVTSIANRYGAGIADLNCGDLSDITNAAVAGSRSAVQLERLADAADIHPPIGRQCPATLAAAR